MSKPSQRADYRRAYRQRSKNRRWQERHRRLGLCIVCSEPNVNGWHCELHRRSHGQARRAWYYRHRDRITAERAAEIRAKQALGLCGRAGCDEPRQVVLGKPRWACRRHLLQEAERQRRRRQEAA